jgi:HPt (histidine-containing phosphotransfer) domain-containing protein
MENIEFSLKGVTEFLQLNQDLIKTLGQTAKDAADEIKTVASQLEDLRQQSKELVEGLNTQPFDVGADAAVRQQQQGLLDQIAKTQKKIEKFIDAPELTTPLYGDLAGLYVELANTYNQGVRQFVQFTDDEITEINGLLQQATLDAIARQRWADVLAGAVALTKVALKVGLKLAAA